MRRRGSAVLLIVCLCAFGALGQDAPKAAPEKKPKDASAAEGKEPGKAAPVKKAPPEEDGKKGKARQDDDAEVDEKKKKMTLPEMTVTGRRDSYRTLSIYSGTLTDTPVIELPFSFESVNETQLTDMGITSLQEGLGLFSGITPSEAPFPVALSSGMVSMRGFSGTELSLNAFTMTKDMSAYMDSVGIERIEVFNGPLGPIEGGPSTTSTRTGNGAGGAVNILTKKPFGRDQYNVRFLSRYGGDSLYRFEGDINKRITQDGRILFRLPAAVETGKPFYLPHDYDRSYSYSLYPSMILRPVDDLEITLEGSVQERDFPSYFGVPVIKGALIAGYDTYYGNEDARIKYRGYSAQPSAKWKVCDLLTIRAGGSWIESDTAGKSWGLNHNCPQWRRSIRRFNADQWFNWLYGTRTSNLAYFDTDYFFKNYGAYLNTLFKFDLGPTKHKLVAGIDYQECYSNSESFWYWNGPVTNVKYPPVVDFDPALFANARYSPTHTCVERKGVLVQEQMELGPVRFLVGSRFDEHSSARGNKLRASSPRLGVTIMATPTVALYGNYTATTTPNFGYLNEFDDEVTTPWSSCTKEIGVKVQVVDDLLVTLSGFEQWLEDKPIIDASRTVVGFEDEMYRGSELTAYGRIGRHWDLAASYTYLGMNTARSSNPEFKPWPKNSVNTWLTYRFDWEPLRDSKVGFGYKFVDVRDYRYAGTYMGPEYVLDEYHIFRASFEYALPWVKGATARFEVNNLFDERGFSSVRHLNGNPIPPRTFGFSMALRF